MAHLDDYNFIKEKKYSIIRIIWSLTYVIFILLAIGLIETLRRDFLINPTVTTLESSSHPVSNIPFPGVAICNMNKISKKEAADFAKEIAPRNNLSEEEIFQTVKVLGKLYDFDYTIDDDGDDSERMQNIIDDLGLDLIELMKRLAPNCNELLERCRWKGVITNCTDLFQMKFTYDGYCCIFNHIHDFSDFDKSNNHQEQTCQAGMTQGLSVLLKNNLKDYVYAPLNSEGVTVQIFEPKDYPDKASGSLNEVIAKVNNEVFVEVVPTTIKTERAVKAYPVSKRQCLFDDERPTKLHGFYSQSDCNVDCRISSTLALCQCIPFMIPFSTKETVCTLNDLACLNRFKNKWNFLYPDDNPSGLLNQEIQNSLRCNQRCYPSCDGTSYQVHPNKATVILSNRIKENNSIVRIYFGARFSDLYKQDVVFYWFEILSNYGGTFGIIIGLSLVSIVEFCIFSFQKILSKLRSEEKNSNETIN